MSKKDTPIIVGVAQNTQDKNAVRLLDPLNLIAEECQNALIDTGVEDLRDFIDTIYMSTISSWIYENSFVSPSIVGSNDVPQFGQNCAS